ncbi:unnamed protein product, partial [Discosporangium mesarthrocarpum]
MSLNILLSSTVWFLVAGLTNQGCRSVHAACTSSAIDWPIEVHGFAGLEDNRNGLYIAEPEEYNDRPHYYGPVDGNYTFHLFFSASVNRRSLTATEGEGPKPLGERTERSTSTVTASCEFGQWVLEPLQELALGAIIYFVQDCADDPTEIVQRHWWLYYGDESPGNKILSVHLPTITCIPSLLPPTPAPVLLATSKPTPTPTLQEKPDDDLRDSLVTAEE